MLETGFMGDSMRASWCLLLCLGAGPVLAAAPDANVQGFKAYEKGDYKKAHALFEKALKKDPANPYARLNRARTRTLLQHKMEDGDDFDYCDFAKNWLYLALADLSKAVELNREALLPKIDEDQQGLKVLKAREEYKKWRRAVAVLAEEKGAVDAVLGSKSEWAYAPPGRVVQSVDMAADQRVVASRMGMTPHAPAKWRRVGTDVELTPVAAGEKARTWKLKVRESYFNQGAAYFHELTLEPEGRVEAPSEEWMQGPLVAGPLVHDCG